MSLASGHKVVPLEGEELAKQKKDFIGYKSGLVRLNPERWLFTTAFLKYGDKYYNFKFEPNDVLLMTWPKCGTTWMQEIVWTMRNNPDLGHALASLSTMARSPFIEMDFFLDDLVDFENVAESPLLKNFDIACPGRNPRDGIMLQMAELASPPRTIKTHLPLSLFAPSLLETTKVVYVARNPKDVVVSFHHHSRMIKVHGYVGSFPDFVQYFVDDDLAYGPYWLHLKEAWEKRHHPNLHFVFYEDLKEDIMGELRKLNDFLGTELTDNQLNNVAKHSSFSEMKARDAMGLDKDETLCDQKVISKEGGFFRKGETGSWKAKLTPELEDKVDKWITRNLNDFGINFKYCL